MSDLTAEQLETGRRNLLSQLRHDLKRDLSEDPVDADTMRDLVVVLEGLAPREPSSEFLCSQSPDGRHNTVAALGGNDEPLGYNHCGYCGKKVDW